MADKKKIFFVMGVSGTGKTTVGKLLASALEIPFFDGDDYHPKANIEKMASGKPLNDDDRRGWLLALNELAKNHQEKGVVIACSALKEKYRTLLQSEIETITEFVYLEGSFETVKSRLDNRKGHFMTAELLQSQFDTLEPPKDAITVSILLTPEEIVEQVLKK